MNFGHFSTQNTSVKVEISNQVKCHTAQRSEARGGRAGPEAGRRRSRPPPATFVARAGAGGESRGAGRGGGAARHSRGPQSYRPQGEALERSESHATSGSCLGPPSVGQPLALAGRGAPRGRETLPSSPARKGPAVLSCLVAAPLPPRPATLCNPIAAICSPGSRRPARSRALPRPAL